MVQLRTEGSGDQKFYRTIEGEVVQYIGIAADEGQRTERHIEKVKKGLEQLPLVDANWTEQMCMDWCRENKLLSPIYENTTRGGMLVLPQSRSGFAQAITVRLPRFVGIAPQMGQ